MKILVTEPFMTTYGALLQRLESTGGTQLQPVVLPEERALTVAELQGVEVAFFSGDRLDVGGNSFFTAVETAPDLRWLHVFHAGVESPRYAALLERGVRLSTSSGSHAEPIAQTVIGALLYFARGFEAWRIAQLEHRWARVPRSEAPRDLRGQTMVIVGLGEIGTHVARIARELGLRTIGVRRSPAREDDVVDQVRHPRDLAELLPMTDWLVLSCPLTPETLGLVDRVALKLLPNHARVFNVARGPVIVTDHLVEAIEQHEIAGAYLDVFDQEPLPEDSPLWDLPGVIISPHNSAVSAGNDLRATEIFIENVRRWCIGETLHNEVIREG